MVPGTAWVLVEEGPDPVTEAVTVTLTTVAVEHDLDGDAPALVLVCKSIEVNMKGDRVWVELGQLLRRESAAGQSTIFLRFDDEPAVEAVWGAAWIQDFSLLPLLRGQRGGLHRQGQGTREPAGPDVEYVRPGAQCPV